QASVNGATVPVAPAVLVTDANSNPVPGGAGSVTVAPPHQLIGPGTGTTDSDGRTTFPTIGVPRPPGTATINFPRTRAPPATTTVDVMTGPPSTIAADPHAPQTAFGSVASAVPGALLPAVIVKQSDGTPVGGVRVHFTVAGGTISVGGASGVTTGSILTGI